MTKESGIPIILLVDDHLGDPKDISGDIRTVGLKTPRGVMDITGLDKSGIERLLLLADGEITLGGVFNDGAGKSHDVFKTVPSTSVVRTVSYSVSGQTLAMEMLFADYSLDRNASGELVWSVTGQLADGAVPTWS